MSVGRRRGVPSLLRSPVVTSAGWLRGRSETSACWIDNCTSVYSIASLVGYLTYRSQTKEKVLRYRICLPKQEQTNKKKTKERKCSTHNY